MSTLSQTEIESALDYNADRGVLDDPSFIGDVQELLGITRSEQRDEAFVEALSSDLHWLLSGWWACARHPAVVRIQCERWLDKYVGRARTAARRLGWEADMKGPDGGKILAALTRAANSGRGSTQIQPFRSGDGPLATLKRFYLADRDGSPRGYDKPDRWKKISAWKEFDGPAPDAEDDLLQGLDFAVPAERHDGSPVAFPTGLG